MLLLLVMLDGREELMRWPPTTMVSFQKGPQLFSNKVVLSPSVIVRWSQAHVGCDSMSKAVNCKVRISPCSTCIVSVFSRLVG